MWDNNPVVRLIRETFPHLTIPDECFARQHSDLYYNPAESGTPTAIAVKQLLDKQVPQVFSSGYRDQITKQSALQIHFAAMSEYIEARRNHKD